MKISVPHWIQEGCRRKRILWFIGGFLLGMVIGYRLGLLRIYERTTQSFQNSQLGEWWMQASSFLVQSIWTPFANWFNTFSPSLGFASDVIAYQAAIIAIAIPLSLDIISRISERYQSGVITKEFNRQWQLKTLLILVIIDALSGVTLKFFVDTKVDAGWKLLAWLIFIFFIATNIVLFAFFDNLRQYATKTKFLLDRLFDELTQVLYSVTTKRSINDKQLKVAQEQFISALEGIGDILVFETKNHKNNQPIIDGLNQIQNKAQEFFLLQQQQPERFPKLLYSHELLQLHEANQLEASAQLAFFPDKYLVALMAIVNQFLRLREAALEVQNLEIARLATYNLIWLLKHLSQGTGHEQSIEKLLRVMADLRYANSESQDDLAYTLAVTWYISIVFKNSFNLTYLGTFDHYFVPCIREIISSSKSKLFEELLQTLHHSVDLQHSDEDMVERLQILLRRLEYQLYTEANRTEQLGQKLSTLKTLSERLQTQKQLHQWLELFKEIENIIYRHFNTVNQEELKKQLEKIHDHLKFSFKFSHLINLIFDLGAYCIFKKRYDYLYELWAFRQPNDADAGWLGHDIVPTSLLGLFNFYFLTSVSERGLLISWENHHGSSRYYNQYFLILLLREFLNLQVTTNQDRQNLISTFQIPTALTPHLLRNIPFQVDRLIPLAGELITMSDSLQILGFDVNQLDNAIQDGLIPFLESLKPKANEQLEQQLLSKKISTTKVKEFKSDFLKGYHERASVRELFNLFGLYENKTHESGDANIPLFGFSRVEQKTIFVEEWYVDYTHLGLHFGHDFASSENSELLVKVLKACKLLENSTLDNIIENLEENLENLIIIRVNAGFDERLYNNERFKAKGIAVELKELDIPDFIGSYIYKRYTIPVVEYFCQIPSEVGVPAKATLVIDKTHLGKLFQYAPDAEGQPYQREQHFAFCIGAFAEDQMLMNELLQKPQDWLLAKGDEAQQRAYLETQALIRICEKFTLEIDPAFVGFLIPESDSSID